nr:unnamed protein product [Callosobruchus analis]
MTKRRCQLKAPNLTIYVGRTTLTKILGLLDGDYTTYLSDDSVETEDDGEHLNFSNEFLNSIIPSGMSQHRLRLKAGTVVMLLTNLKTKKGLCNGTKLVISSMRKSSGYTEELSSGSEYDPNEGSRLKKSLAMAISDTNSGNEGIVNELNRNSLSNRASVQESIEIVPKGKKRLRSPEKWKRNIKKRRLFNEKNKRVPRYRRLSTHAEQTIYLQDCVKKVEKSRSRRRKNDDRSQSRTVFSYEVSGVHGKISLCQNAFLAVHGIFKSRLEKKVRTGAEPADNRGRHDNRPNKTKSECLQEIRKFISELPARESHYTRSDNRNRKYLDPNLSITVQNFLSIYDKPN